MIFFSLSIADKLFNSYEFDWKRYALISDLFETKNDFSDLSFSVFYVFFFIFRLLFFSFVVHGSVQTMCARETWCIYHSIESELQIFMKKKYKKVHELNSWDWNELINLIFSFQFRGKEISHRTVHKSITQFQMLYERLMLMVNVFVLFYGNVCIASLEV